MEHLLETLRTCVENEPRKLATAQLRQSQQDHPQAFLATTWAVVGDATQGMERRFFYATTVLSFVEESWRSNVAADLQQQYLQLYVSLVLHEQLTHEAFARKVGSVVAAMAKKQAKKTLMGELPTSVAFVWSAYTEAIAQYVKDGATSMDRLGQLLLMLHMLLRDIQTRRIGDTFEVLCRAMVAPLYSLFTLFTQLHPLEHYRTYLYLLKCSLRVFGEGAFDESFNSFLLTMSWQLAGDVRTASATATAADNTATHRLRLLEYAMKIQEKLITYFPAMLRTMHPDFFLAEPSTSEGGETCCSVLSLAVLLAEMGSAGGMSEKVVCRSMRIVTGLLSAEDGDEFVMSVAERLSRSSLLPRFMRCLIATYMPDDTSEAAVERWATEPELVAEELLIDMDDEDAAVSCAEQVFLALTGSTTCATAALAAAWDIVNVMLAEGNIPEISAALHAIGLGYYTMTEGPNSPQYLNFLETKLLPILQSSNAEGRSSPFVLRRVVWLVGMWCETVQEAHHRGAVHAALEGMLQNEQNPVVLLAALRTVENFISDNNFTLAEVPPTLATTLLHTVQRVLPALRSPTAVKELAALVHVLIEKEVLQAQGEFIVEVFAPSAVRLIETYNKPSTATESEDEEEEVNWSTLGMLIQCVQSGIKICRNDAAIWAIYHPLVLPCITPGQTVTPWAEDYAWELLLTMVRSTHMHNPMTEEALNTVLSHTQRDFSMIHLVYRTTFALLLLRNQPVEGLLTLHHVKGWLTTMTEAPVPELVSSLFALLMAVVCLTQDNNVRNCCLQQCLSCLILSNDVQSDGYMVYMAVLLRAALAHYQPPSVAVEALRAGLTAPGLTAAPLPEALVLLLDVCPDELSSRVIVLLLRYLQGSGVMAISAEDSAMIANTLAGVAISWEGAEARHPAEMTLELIGDEDVFPTSPHVERVMQRFAWLQQQSE